MQTDRKHIIQLREGEFLDSADGEHVRLTKDRKEAWRMTVIEASAIIARLKFTFPMIKLGSVKSPRRSS